MTGAVHQLLPSFSPGDAIGSHVRRLRDQLQALGLRSEVLCTAAHSSLKGEATHYRKARLRPDDVLLYHLSCSDAMASWLLDQPQRLLVDFHNITEARWFGRWAPPIAHDMRLARLQMAALAPRAHASVAHSAFSAEELEARGYRGVEVAPLLFSVPSVPAPRPEPVPTRGARWLFVGRLVPNKCQHDVIAALTVARRTTDPDATLLLVGGRTVPSYADALERLVDDLGVRHAVRFADHVPDEELDRAYREADVFVCLSRHEGFGAPIVEAMGRGLPVVALDAAAVGETAGDAALLLGSSDPPVVAAAVAALAADPELVDGLRRAGLERAAGLRPEVTGPALAARIAELAGG